MTHVGIDPGVQAGAIAWLIGPLTTPGSAEAADGKLHIRPLPAVKHGRAGRRYDRPAMLALFHTIPKPLNVMLEAIQIHQHDARQSVSINGVGFGHIQMALTAANVPDSDIEIVEPKDWQALMHMGFQQYPNPKARSIMACQKLFPGVSLMRSSRATKPDDGFADAALLALYAKRIHTGEA